MARRSRAEEATLTQHEMVGFVAGMALCLLADATKDLRAAAEALAARRPRADRVPGQVSEEVTCLRR